MAPSLYETELESPSKGAVPMVSLGATEQTSFGQQVRTAAPLSEGKRIKGNVWEAEGCPSGPLESLGHFPPTLTGWQRAPGPLGIASYLVFFPFLSEPEQAWNSLPEGPCVKLLGWGGAPLPYSCCFQKGLSYGGAAGLPAQLHSLLSLIRSCLREDLRPSVSSKSVQHLPCSLLLWVLSPCSRAIALSCALQVPSSGLHCCSLVLNVF